MLDLARQETGDDDQLAIGLQMIEEFAEPFEELLVYVWRRHLAAAVARMEALSAREEDLHTVAAHRRLRGHRRASPRCPTSSSEERIGDLVELFEARCADVVTLRTAAG